MSYVAVRAPGSLIRKKFTTVDSTGAPTTLAGTPVISVYKNSDLVESTAGVTLTVDFDSVTGLNNVAIDTSADATFYSAGADFDVVITTGTVGGTSVVGYVVFSFSLGGVAIDAVSYDSTAQDLLQDVVELGLLDYDAAKGTPILARLPAALSAGGNMKADLQTIKEDALTESPPYNPA